MTDNRIILYGTSENILPIAQSISKHSIQVYSEQELLKEASNRCLMVLVGSECEKHLKLLRTKLKKYRLPVLLVNDGGEVCWNCSSRYGCVDVIRASESVSEAVYRLNPYLSITKLLKCVTEAKITLE